MIFNTRRSDLLACEKFFFFQVIINTMRNYFIYEFDLIVFSDYYKANAGVKVLGII